MMLLAVVAAAGLVYAPVDRFGIDRPLEDMDDGVSVVDDGHHRDVGDEAGVPGLPTAFRVESRLVEHDRRTPLVLAALDDAGVELEEVGILAVEQPRHALAGAGRSQLGSMLSTYL